jgi:acetolactate synthase small subunit
MAQFTASIACSAGCLDQVARAFDTAGARVESLACLSREGDEGIVTFSVADDDRLKEDAFRDFGGRKTDVPVLQVKVPNAAGCLAGVTSAFSRAGVVIDSLACACAAGDESGIVSVGLRSPAG